MNSTKTELCLTTQGGAPTAIVLAGQLVQEELKDVFGCLEYASLIVAGKTVVEHILLELQELGVEQCFVLAGENAEEIQKLVDRDGRWGMVVTVMNYVRSVDEVLREFKSLCESSGLLVIEADRLRGFCLKEFLKQAAESEYSLLEAKFGSLCSGITLLKPTSADFITNAMPIYLHDIEVNNLNTASDFHKANFDVMSGVYQGLEPSVMLNGQLGRRQHWASHVSTPGIAASLGFASNDSQMDWEDVMIERHCQIGRQVSMNSVIINHGVYVEAQSELENAVVMPKSIVSSTRELSNCIVHRDAVFDLS